MTRSCRFRALCIALITSLLAPVSGSGQDRSIILQSTTSTANSGLYDFILPVFERKTGVRVNVVAVGTGQAIKNAMRGDGDVLLVHAREEEENFVASGFGVARYNLMYNDYVLIGPKTDPANIAGSDSPMGALRRIFHAGAIFVSRGDRSGTHKQEMILWKKAALDPVQKSGHWYRETGSGMGATLNVAVGMGGYVLADRATWVSFRNKRGHRILVAGDKLFFNQYGIILVNPKKHRRVNARDGQIFIDWMLSREGQTTITRFRVDGQQLFFPNATRGR